MDSHSLGSGHSLFLPIFQQYSRLNDGKCCCVRLQDEKGNWRIQCVSASAGSFENRRSLPAAWRGVRDAELDELTGLPGGIFVHAGGFIGGHKTLEGATQMAIKALTLD